MEVNIHDKDGKRISYAILGPGFKEGDSFDIGGCTFNFVDGKYITQDDVFLMFTKDPEVSIQYLVYTDSKRTDGLLGSGFAMPMDYHSSRLSKHASIDSALEHMKWDPCTGLDGTWEHTHQLFRAVEIPVKKKVEVTETEVVVPQRTETITYEVE